MHPFFGYVAHCAPHWPLHAPPERIAKHRGRYRNGWDALRIERHAKLRSLGLIENWECSPRDEACGAWDDVPEEQKDWEDARMATYAAQIDIMDDGIGRILQTLEENNLLDDTLILFLSDNGGCAEFLKEDGDDGSFPECYGDLPCSDGTKCKVGNDPSRMPGGRDTFMSYDLPWANASNTPFRLFKSWVHEGGIATPFILHWPNGTSHDAGTIHHQPWIMLDIAATIYDVCGVPYPTSTPNGVPISPLEGRSFASVCHDNDSHRPQPLFWEHQGNRAVRDGKWKLVNRHGCAWELFDMNMDRTELHDCAGAQHERVTTMIAKWEAWALRCDVKTWPHTEIPEGEIDWCQFPWLW